MIDLGYIFTTFFQEKQILYFHKYYYNLHIQIASLKSCTAIICFFKPPKQLNLFSQIEHFWRVSFMNWFNMYFQVIFSWKTVITNWAIVWFLYFMNWVDMSFQVTTSRSFVVTNMTFVRFHTFMNWFNM